MLRCGQMMVAEALLRHRGGDLETEASRAARDAVRKDVLAHFADVPSAEYSIHAIALGGLRKMKKTVGHGCGSVLRPVADGRMGPWCYGVLQVGEWFGPNCLAQVLRGISVDALESPTAAKSVILTTHVAMDSIVCIEDVLASVKQSVDALAARPGADDASAGDATWQPVLLLIPLRLGLDDMAERHFAPLRRMFELPQCVGAVGGRPNAAFYFAGCRDDLLLYLDPHSYVGPPFFCPCQRHLCHVTYIVPPTVCSPIQPTVGAFRRDTSIASYSPPGLLPLPMAEADPSLCLGFLCSTRRIFDDLLARIAKVSPLDVGFDTSVLACAHSVMNHQLKAEFPDEQPLFSVVEKDFAAALGGKDGDEFSFTNDDDGDDDDGFEMINVL